MEIFAVLVIWLALCGVAAAIASSKGRSGIGIFFLALLLSPLVGIIVAAFMTPNPSAQGKKKCPACAEFVQPEARVCRFCQHSFVEEEAAAETARAAKGNQEAAEQQARLAAEQTRLAEEQTRLAAMPWMRRNGAELVSALFAAFILCGVALFAVKYPPKNPSTTATTTSTSSTDSTPPTPTPNWNVDRSTNSIDGTTTLVFTDSGIIIRFTGKRLEAFVRTTEMVGEDTSVRIRFDDGKPIRQSWSRSEDYQALFSPDPWGLVARLQSSKKFYIEYSPYEKVPETLSFDVGGLVIPKELLAHAPKAVAPISSADDLTRYRRACGDAFPLEGITTTALPDHTQGWEGRTFDLHSGAELWFISPNKNGPWTWEDAQQGRRVLATCGGN